MLASILIVAKLVVLKDLPPLTAYSISSTTGSLSLIILIDIWEPASLTCMAIDTKALESVDAHKVLGVTIQSNFKWDLHINEDVAKASKRLYILHVLKRGGVPPADLLKVYFALIRSVLEYCCPVWHNGLPVKLSDSIERVQKRALRIIFPALHYQEALATTGCVSLHTRRMELCSKLFTKIKEPEFRLRHLVPPTRSQAQGRSLRNKDRPSLISSGDVPLCWWHVI